MPLPSGALAVRLATGQIALHQGTAKDLPQRRQKFGEALTALPQGQVRDLGEVLSFGHRAARTITPILENASENLAFANFLLSH
jgi:hypothetical protein